MEIKQQLFCRHGSNPILRREHWQHTVGFFDAQIKPIPFRKAKARKA